jgi:putative addiction module component (TIGR02574 family)
MKTSLREITNSLMTLPRAERLEVADSLYANAVQGSPEELEQAWSEEVSRRLRQYRAGQAPVHTEAQVHARIQKILGETRRRTGRRNR